LVFAFAVIVAVVPALYQPVPGAIVPPELALVVRRYWVVKLAV